MRIAVCDDDEMFRSDLKNKIYEYSNTRRLEMVIDEFACGEDLVSAEAQFDIVFLDYKMGLLDGLNAARVLRKNNLNCAIIFLTNYPDFVYESFEVSAFRFFEKPLGTDRLYKALDDYFRMFGNDYPLLLRCNREITCIDTKDILFLEAENKNCIIHTVRQPFRCAKTMAQVSKLVPTSHFLKVHRAFIINLNYIQKYDKARIHLKNGAVVYISRNYHSSFKTEYMRYSKNRLI